MNILALLLSITIASSLSPLSATTLNFLQGYAFGIGMGDKVPEIMDCILEVILIKPEVNIIMTEFKKDGALNVWNGIVDSLYSFDNFAQECGNTVIGLNNIQKTLKKVLKTPKLFKFIFTNLSQESEQLTELMKELGVAIQDQDTYQAGYLIGTIVNVAFAI